MRVDNSLNISNKADCNDSTEEPIQTNYFLSDFFNRGGREKEKLPQSKLMVGNYQGDTISVAQKIISMVINFHSHEVSRMVQLRCHNQLVNQHLKDKEMRVQNQSKMILPTPQKLLTFFSSSSFLPFPASKRRKMWA